MKKLFTLLFCILLLVQLVSAVPPFQETAGTSDILDIRFPQVEFVKIGTKLDAHTHVFNLTDGLIKTNVTTDCIVHLYNASGNHILQENMGFDNNGLDFELEINSSIFTVLGHHSFIIQCNDSSSGGFVSGSFRVTSDGEDDIKSDTSPGISATIFLLFITTLLFLFPFLKDFSKHKWANNIIKRAFWTVGIFVLMWNSSILATIADNANLDIVSHLFRYMAMFGWAGYVSAAYMVLKSLFEMIATYKIHKEKKRFGKGDQGGF